MPWWIGLVLALVINGSQTVWEVGAWALSGEATRSMSEQKITEARAALIGRWRGSDMVISSISQRAATGCLRRQFGPEEARSKSVEGIYSASIDRHTIAAGACEWFSAPTAPSFL
jgi:hypothetical protein